jgi:formate dehydrogenase subunit delta
MNTERLIQMANQIGGYFDADPDRVAARDGVAEHIVRFWEKRMRRQLYATLDVASGALLMPLVREALVEHRRRILGIRS